jgi:hypothetical protein
VTRLWPVLCACLWALAPAARAQAPAFDLARRTAAAALLDQGMPDAARDTLREAIARDPRFAFDRVNLAIALIKLHGEAAGALEALDAAARIEPSYPVLHYLRGLALIKLRRYPQAVPAFDEALRRGPLCAEALFQKARALELAGETANALKAFEAFLAAAESAFTGDQSRLRVARYLAHKYLSLLETDDARAERHQELALSALGPGERTPPEDALDFGPCARLLDPHGPAIRPELERERVPPPEPCKAPPLELAPEPWPGGRAAPPGSAAAMGWTTSGLARIWIGDGALERDGTAWKASPPPGPGVLLAAADLNDDRDDDLLMRLPSGGLEVRSYPPGRFAVALEGLRSTGPVLAVDQDHDGDLDVLAAGEVRGVHGLWLYQNRTPVTAPAPPLLALVPSSTVSLTAPTTAAIVGLCAGDVDGGNDLDVVAFERGSSPAIFFSRRHGRFDRTVVAGAPAAEGPGVLSDVTADGELDLAYPTTGGVVVLAGRGDGSFDAPRRHLAGAKQVEVLAADLDGDMREDLIARDPAGALTLLLGEDGGHRVAPLPAGARSDSTPLIEDLDLDGALDLALPGGSVLHNRSASRAGHVRVALSGLGGVTHSRGVGSRVWVRAGGRMTRREMRHAGEIFALGGCARADLVRIQWTNGIRQSELRKDARGYDPLVPSGTVVTAVQQPGPKASCPYLYVDRGAGPEYVTDVLAGAPLGLPSPAGGLIPTCPQELVLIPRAAWAPVRGRYRMRLTEEFREIAYVDEARLWVVDHAPALVVMPDSGMGAPSGPPRLVAFERVDPPRVALGPAGEDVTLLVAQTDGHHFEPPRSRIQGLAPEHAIELAFPPHAAGRRVYLVIEGLVYFSDAGINTRLAQSDPTAMAPPRLEVPAPGGGWRTALASVRFPAGRSKTAITEITGLLSPDDPRLRLVSRMRIYPDRLALGLAATDARVGAVRTRILRPARADVVFHGIAPLGPDPDRPPWFIVSGARRRSSLEASFLAPRGLYTRPGPVGPLLAAYDDLCAVIGPGDGLDLEWIAPPPAPGLARDLMLELSGYDKDAHPATFASDRVGPLPHRGMPPYGPDSRFDEATQERLGRAHGSWNTRYRAGWGGAVPHLMTP